MSYDRAASGWLLCIVLVMGISGCRNQDSPVSDSTLVPSTDDKLVGTWYTPAKYSAFASEGYQILSNGKVLRLLVDQQNKLQYDPLAAAGQYSLVGQGLCTFTFPGQPLDTVSSDSQAWLYKFLQADSIMSLIHYPLLGPGLPTYETRYVRKNIGESVR